MNFLLTTFLFLFQEATRSPNNANTVGDNTVYEPHWTLFIIAAVAIVGLLAFGFYKLGWHWPGKGKGTGSGNVFKNDPPAGGI